MKILTRYVLKEHVGPLVFALSALTSLLILNYVAKQLGNLSGKGLHWTVIAEFLLLSIPFTVALTFPMAVLVSTLFAFSKLTAENEIPAMKANGVSMASLMFPVIVWGVLVSLGMLAFNDQVVPRANHRLATLQRDIARKRPTFALREQVLNEVLPNRGLALRTDAIDRTGNGMRNVHIYDVSSVQSVRTVHADSGEMYLTPDQRDLILRLYDGYVLDVDKTDPTKLNRVYFTVNQMRIRGVGNELSRVGMDGMKGDREQSICDMSDHYELARETSWREREEMRARILHLVRQSVSGEDFIYMPPDSAPVVPPARSWGTVYCDGVTSIAKLSARVRGVPYTPREPLRPPGDDAANDLPAEPLVTVHPPEPVVDVPVEIPLDYFYQAPRYGPIGVSGFTESVSAELAGVTARMQTTKRQMNRYAVEIHKKFSLAAACIVFILIGAPFALRFPRGGVGLVIGTSLVIFAVSYVGLIGGETLADRATLSPFLAMWGANFVLAIIGIALLARMGRESTGRGGSLRGTIQNIRYWWEVRRTGSVR